MGGKREGGEEGRKIQRMKKRKEGGRRTEGRRKDRTVRADWVNLTREDDEG